MNRPKTEEEEEEYSHTNLKHNKYIEFRRYIYT